MFTRVKSSRKGARRIDARSVERATPTPVWPKYDGDGEREEKME
jgi:hypothetical protein